jgi:hypothetical protein
MSKEERHCNEQISDVNNPSSSEHEAAVDIHSRQLNPKDQTYHSSRESAKARELGRKLSFAKAVLKLDNPIVPRRPARATLKEV